MLANDVPVKTPVGLNLPVVIHDLACQAATICSPGDKICNVHSLIFSGSCRTCLFTIGHCSDKRRGHISILQRDAYNRFSMGMIVFKYFQILTMSLLTVDDTHFHRTAKFLASPYLILVSSQT